MTAALSPWAEILWLVIGGGFVVYALTGGADLGVALWDVLAGGPRADRQRAAIKDAIAPIWEANHVWLIFVIVVLFSAFPRAFAVIGTALHVPIGLALIGIVLRGSAFAFHAYGIQSEGSRRRWSRVFAIASVATPVFFGMIVGAVSGGQLRVEGSRVAGGWFAPWLTPFAVLTGLFTLALFALLSAVYLAAESRDALACDFCRRAMLAEIVAGALALAVLASARAGAPELFAALTASPLTWAALAATAVLAALALHALHHGRAHRARWYAATQVALVIVNWGLAMDHHLVRPDVTLTTAGARAEVLPTLTIALAAGAVILLPALYYLYRVFKLGR